MIWARAGESPSTPDQALFPVVAAGLVGGDLAAAGGPP